MKYFLRLFIEIKILADYENINIKMHFYNICYLILFKVLNCSQFFNRRNDPVIIELSRRFYWYSTGSSAEWTKSRDCVQEFRDTYSGSGTSLIKKAFREFQRESELGIPARARNIYYFSSFQRIKVATKVVPLWTA